MDMGPHQASAGCVTQVVAGEDRTVYLSAPDQTTAEAWLAAISALWPLSAARQEVSTLAALLSVLVAASVLTDRLY
jgi:hypothetical protein